MTDDHTASEEMRLYALEYMVSAHFAALHSQTGDPRTSLATLRRSLVEKARRDPIVRGVDAALSDMASAELEDAFDRLLRMQAAFLGVEIPRD